MLKKELFIFISIFLFLALGMHMGQWLTHPMEHLLRLESHKMPYHPLLYTTLVYVVIFLIRRIMVAFFNLFRRK